MSETVDWKTQGVKVIPKDSLDTNTPQTPGMNRAAAQTPIGGGAGAVEGSGAGATGRDESTSASP